MLIAWAPIELLIFGRVVTPPFYALSEVKLGTTSLLNLTYR